MNCGGLKLVTDIRDHHSILHNFETRVLRMVGSTIDSDFTCRYAICIMEPSRFCFLQTLSCVRKVIQKSISIAYFRDSGKGNFYIRDPLISRDSPVRPFMHGTFRRSDELADT